MGEQLSDNRFERPAILKSCIDVAPRSKTRCSPAPRGPHTLGRVKINNSSGQGRNHSLSRTDEENEALGWRAKRGAKLSDGC